MKGITSSVKEQERDRFADFLIEHYESQREIEHKGQRLGSNYNVPASVTIYAMIYNYGSRFEVKKALDWFNRRWREG